MLTPIAVPARPHHHGQQPGRVRRRVLRDHRRRPAHRRSHPARRGPRVRHHRPVEDRDHRATSRSTRRRRARRASRSGLIRVEKYFEGTNITAYAGPPPESERHRLLLGRLPGRHRGGHRDPAARSTRSATRRCRACTSCSAPTRARSTRRPARRSSSSATARSGRANSTTSSCDRESTSSARRSTRTRQARGHLRQAGARAPRSSPRAAT